MLFILLQILRPSIVLIPMLGIALGVIIGLYIIFSFFKTSQNDVYFYMFWGSLLPQIPLITLLFAINYNCSGSLQMLLSSLYLSWLGLLYGLYYYHFKVKKLYKKE